MNHSMDSTQNETLNSCFKIDFVRAFLTKWRSFISLFQALRKWKGAKVKGTFLRVFFFFFVFALSQFSGPDYLGDLD